MPILAFLSNSAIVNATPGAVDCSGSGPLRLVEFADEWRVVVVNADQIIGTAVQFPMDMNDTDRNIPISLVERPPS